MSANNNLNANSNLPAQTKKTAQKTNRILKNWKEELVVWSIVINTIIALIQLIITLVMIGKK